MSQSRRVVEFYVDRKEPRHEGVFVIGRCLDAAIIRGDRFQSVHTLKPGATRENVRQVSLTVTSIDVWTLTNTEQIDPGYTGRLAIVGEGADLIIDGEDVLHGEMESK